MLYEYQIRLHVQGLGVYQDENRLLLQGVIEAYSEESAIAKALPLRHLALRQNQFLVEELVGDISAEGLDVVAFPYDHPTTQDLLAETDYRLDSAAKIIEETEDEE